MVHQCIIITFVIISMIGKIRLDKNNYRNTVISARYDTVHIFLRNNEMKRLKTIHW